ncbi:MAG: hypothetical protein JWM91_5098 [Rhodospirillales bacterium]|nr:hypothetical protein [Rhodospirillales bacterium]
MSLGEKIYLALVVVMFVSFGIVMGTLSWLDARNDKIRLRSKANELRVARRNRDVLQLPRPHLASVSH